MTDEKIKLFEAVMSNSKLTPAQVVQLTNMFNQPKPQVIITVEGGSVQDASANMDIELIVADIDNIKLGDDLDYPCLAGETQEEFDEAVQKVYEQIIFRKAKELKDEPVNSVRIFIHDHEDQFPFSVMVDDEVIATYKTFEEAFTFLQEYLKARKV